MASSKKLSFMLLALAFVGFIDASYLSAEHYLDRIPPCSIAGSNCTSVLTSPYATVWNVPISMAGAGYYLVLVLLSANFYKTGERRSLMAFVVLSSLGALISIELLYIQLFILHATCLYCLISAVLSVSMAILSFSTFLKSSRGLNG